MNIPIEHFLYLSAVLFCIGLYAALTKKNTIIVLIGIELMINAAVINLAAFGAFDQNNEGQMMALFAIVLSAASIVVALAIILKVYQHFSTVNANEVDSMKN
jgi:NADH:ubiquinone oxidoreductase subunit K